MTDADAPTYCTAKPVPGSYMSAPCVDCGHAMVLHIGCEHCPVCELADLNAKARREPVTDEQVARGEKTINDMRAYLGMPPLAGLPEVGTLLPKSWSAGELVVEAFESAGPGVS